MNYKMKFKLLLLIIPQLLLANVKVNALFSDHMVVQREAEIPVWGWADPNEKIVLEASWGEKEETIAKADGTWKVMLKTPKAGGPFQMTITGENKVIIDDILSGEVWLCTGQSNMDFALERLLKNSKEPQYQPLVEYIRNEVASANDNELRHIEVSRNTSLFEKQTEFKGRWVSARGEDVKKITATGYFFAKELRKQLNVPVGLVECSWGGTRVQPWISEEVYMADENLKEYFEVNRKEVKEALAKVDAPEYVDVVYEKKLAVWKANGSKGNKPKATRHPSKNTQEPAILYNGMLHAVIPYGIKGAIWYQGESNASYMSAEYKSYFSAMIRGWRSDWNQGDFSFYWVQLAGCKRTSKEMDRGWATVNDQLRRTLKLPNTGMAVLYDIGEADDIHPHNKMDAGKRLALWALKKDYHKKIAVVSGPLYVSHKIKGNKIQIKFTEVGSGLMTGYKHLLEKVVPVKEALAWFEVLGEDGVWEKAEANIVSKNEIEVWSAVVSNPKQVRYAWTGYPEGANLYNREGLPAAVFTTEE